MTLNDLTSLIAQGEGFNLEFKEAFDKSIAKEMCAFANANGGTVLVGVSDRGEIKGLNKVNLNRLRSQIQDIAHSATPAISVNIKTCSNVLVVDVEEGKEKPYAVSGKFYLRQGPNSQQLAPAQIREFFQTEGLVLFDEKLARDFDLLSDFNVAAFKEFCSRSGIHTRVRKEQVLSNLRLLERGKIKNAGALLFAKRITKHIPQATITCVLFQGKDKYKILDRKEFDRDIFSNYEDTIVYLKSKLNTEFIIKGGPREEVLELPEEALRETVLNAIAHRNYFLTGNIQVYIFADRVEITNPGGLVKGMTEKDLGKKSMPRNILLFGLMQRMDLVEQIGSGILRIRQAMKDYKLPAPAIEVDENWFTIIYKRPGLQKDAYQQRKAEGGGQVKTAQKTTQKTTQKQKQILEYLRKYPKAGREEIAYHIKDITVDGVKYNLKSLQNKGLLKRIGPDLGGHWEVGEG